MNHMNRTTKIVAALALLSLICTAQAQTANAPAMTELEGRARAAAQQTEDQALLEKYAANITFYKNTGVITLKDLYRSSHNFTHTERVDLLRVLYEVGRKNALSITSFQLEWEPSGAHGYYPVPRAIWFTYTR